MCNIGKVPVYMMSSCNMFELGASLQTLILGQNYLVHHYKR